MAAGVLMSWPGDALELEAGIRKWINEWNRDPEPFTWTRTAEEIHLRVLPPDQPGPPPSPGAGSRTSPTIAGTTSRQLTSSASGWR
jgi:hypothetical protein